MSWADLRRFALPVLALALAAAAIAAVFTQRQPMTYESTVTLVVQTSAGASDTETFIRTMTALVDSEVVGEELRARVESSLPVDTITANIVVERPPGSSVLTIAYTDTDSDRSVRTAREIIPVFQEQVALLEADQAGQLGQRYAIQPWGSGTIITSDVPPPVLRNAAIAALLGALVGAIGAVLYRQWNPQVRTSSDAEEATGLPVITSPRALGGTRWKRSQWNPTDVMDAVLTRLPGALGERELPRRILVISTEHGPQRGAFIVHLARALQQKGEAVTVVDADLERGTLTRQLGLAGTAGLSDQLRSDDGTTAAVVVPEKGTAAGISVLPAGTKLPVRSVSAAMAVNALGNQSRLIVDSPGLSAHQPLGSLVRAVDAVVVLLVAGSADVGETAALSALTRSLGGAPAAVVLLTDEATEPQAAERPRVPRLAPRASGAASAGS